MWTDKDGHGWFSAMSGRRSATARSKPSGSKKDLSGPAGKPVTLFKASEAPWVRSHVPGEKLYVTDGPFLLRNSRGELLMLWSSFTDEGYAIGLAARGAATSADRGNNFRSRSFGATEGTA